MQANEIRERKGVVELVQKISGAMKSISMSKMQLAQSKIDEFAFYVSNLHDIAQGIIQNLPQSQASVDDLIYISRLFNSTTKKILLVFSTDTGLCGSFFSNCSTKTINAMKSARYDEVLILGKKMFNFIQSQFGDQFTEPFSESDVKIKKNNQQKITQINIKDFFCISNLINNLIDKYNYNFTITLIYHEFLHLGTYSLKNITFDMEKIDQVHYSQLSMKDYFEDVQPDVIQKIFQNWVNAFIYNAYLHNLASENASRFVVTENAFENSNELIKELGRSYNQIRQSGITTDLLGIVSGAID